MPLYFQLRSHAAGALPILLMLILQGVFNTPDGCIGLNKVDSIISQIGLDSAADSRMEVISSRQGAIAGIEEALLLCVL